MTPQTDIAVSGEILVGTVDSDEGSLTSLTQVQTVRVPITIGYFSLSGMFGLLNGTYVYQDVNRKQETRSFAEGNGDFFLLNAAVGYRLPERRGLVSFETSNMLNERFRFQDDNFRTFEQLPSVSPYIPERAFISRITLNF